MKKLLYVTLLSALGSDAVAQCCKAAGNHFQTDYSGGTWIHTDNGDAQNSVAPNCTDPTKNGYLSLTSGKMHFTTARCGRQIMSYYDMGTPAGILSNTGWIADFDILFTGPPPGGAYTNNPQAWLLAFTNFPSGLISACIGGNQNTLCPNMFVQPATNCIALELVSDDPGTNCGTTALEDQYANHYGIRGYAQHNGNVYTSSIIQLTNNQTYYLRLQRTSATSAKVSVYSDANYCNLIGSTCWTIPSGINNLRYIEHHVKTDANPYRVLNAGIDNLKIDNEVKCVPGYAGPDQYICAPGNCVTLGQGNPLGRPYAYSWTPGTGLNFTGVPSPTACPSVTTTYAVTMTTSDGCVYSDNATVFLVPATANAGPDVAFCTSQPPQSYQIGDPNAPANQTYFWSGSGNPVFNPNNTVPDPFVFSSTDAAYTITATNQYGCTATDAVKLYAVTADAGPDRTICIGGAGVQPGSGVEIGGNSSDGPGYTYSWSPATGLACSTCQKTIASPTVNTTYTLTVTAPNGYTCTDNVTISITAFDEQPILNPLSSMNVNCNNLPAYITLSFVQGQTGVPSYWYEWNSYTNSAVNHLSPTSSNAPFTWITNCTNAQPGDVYYVTVTDAIGCQNSRGVTINMFYSPRLAAPDTTGDTMNFNLYPNPATEFVTIQSSDSLADVEVVMYDVLGKPVLMRHYTEFKEEQLDISSFIPGIYFVNMVSSSGVNETRMIVKE